MADTYGQDPQPPFPPSAEQPKQCPCTTPPFRPSEPAATESYPPGLAADSGKGASSASAEQPATEIPTRQTPVACVLRATYRQGSECGQPALYRIYGGDGCYVCCDFMGCESCLGHPVCADHAAKLRTESVAQVPARARKPHVPAFTVDRIHSLPEVAHA